MNVYTCVHRVPGARWEERRTASGRIQYLNHITRTTQWDRPTRYAQNYQPRPRQAWGVGGGRAVYPGSTQTITLREAVTF